MPYDTGFYVIAAVMAFLVGMSKSGFAIGINALTVPLMSLFVPPLVAAAIMLPLLTATDMVVIWKYRNKMVPNLVGMLLPGAVLGILIGSLTVGYIDPAMITLVVALIALWFSALYYAKPFLPEIRAEMGMKTALVFGAIAGMTSFLAHAGGPPVRAFLLGKKLDKSAYVGTMGALFGMINGIKVLPYAMLGQFTAETLWTSLLMVPVLIVGIFAGLKLHNRIDQRLFMRIAYGALTFTGLKLLFDSITTLVA
jgi:uncharacterized membrane protein YfcA